MAKPVLPELDVKRVRQWSENRIPARVRDKVCLKVITRGKTVSMYERRPHWRGKPVEWSKTPIAQLRYEGDGAWTLYFGDRHDKWIMYFDLDTHQPVDVIINELEEDPTGVFWG